MADTVRDGDPERKGMYGWYDPKHLLETGIRVGIANIFGEFLDRRELFGDRNATAPFGFDSAHDYSTREANEGLWIDYAADTGDGWDSTFAVARLLARDNLDFPTFLGATHLTTRGRLLILGGDQVYSTASRDEYRARLQGPFDYAALTEGTRDGLGNADVYALPGNHDWYDGLNSFMGVFVTRRPDSQSKGFGDGRSIGGRRTKQTRSYFALKLPHDWWLIGADAQLSGFIDQGQVAFFDNIAQHHMDDGSNVILCAAAPSWSYVDLDGDADKKFRNYSYLENVITGMAHNQTEKGKKLRRHNLRLVLTGDSHHYSRYIEGPDAPQPGTEPVTDIGDKARCYLTWGGGGAFLHPTQQLRDVSFRWNWPPAPPVAPNETIGESKPFERSFRKKAVYPSVDDSKRLARWVLLFAAWNWKYSLLMGALGLVIAWALAGAADLAGNQLPEMIRNAPDLLQAVLRLFVLMVTFPWVLLTCIGLCYALIYFSDAQDKWNRRIVGVVHFLTYLVLFFALFIVLCRVPPVDLPAPYSSVLLVCLMAFGTAVFAPTVMGCYLFLSLRRRRHWNEAFSALGIKDHKGFLRLHLKDGALTVYPIAIDSVPDGGEGELKPKLIEQPIRIRVS